MKKKKKRRREGRKERKKKKREEEEKRRRGKEKAWRGDSAWPLAGAGTSQMSLSLCLLLCFSFLPASLLLLAAISWLLHGM